MKKIFIYSFVVLFVACSETVDSSPANIAEIVAKSFYKGNETALKEHTTPEGFANFSNLQKMFAKSKTSKANFKLIAQDVKEDVAWIKYSTAYDKTPGIF